MTAQPKLFYRGGIPTTLSTIYSVPSNTEVVVTSMIVVNASGSSANVSLRLGGVDLLKDGAVPPNDAVHFDIRQVMSASDSIEAGTDVSDITLHVSGVEVT